MTIAYGVTPLGFVSKPTATIASEVDSDLKGILGASAGTEPDGSIPLNTMAGQLKSMLVDGFSILYEDAAAVYSAGDPGQAADTSLDNVCAITGTIRDGATKSTVTATCTGDPTTVLLVGRVATVTDTGSRFTTLAQAVIGAATAWAGSTGYLVGDRRTNAGRIYVCITAGTSAGSGGPTTTAADITDNTAHWKYVGEGTGVVDVACEAEEFGALGALAGALATIATPVDGWTTVVNLEDAAVGALRQNDPSLRLRREVELTAKGNTIADGIRARMLRVGEGTNTPVTAVTVFQNQTLVTDGDGLPGKSVEILVDRATSDPDQEIADAVFATVGAGILPYGLVSATVTDSEGYTQTVAYSRPVLVPIYVTVDVVYDPALYPAGDLPDGDEIKKAIVYYGSTSHQIGNQVRAQPIGGAVEFGPTEAAGEPVPGILEVTSVKIGTAPSPAGSTTIAITRRQRATFDTSRVVVNLTPGTP